MNYPGLLDFLKYVVGILVTHPEELVIDHEEADGKHVFRLSLHEEDVGRVIGKEGHTIRSIRSLMNAAAEKGGTSVVVKVENE